MKTTKPTPIRAFLVLAALLTMTAGCVAVASSPGKIALDAVEFDFGTIPNTAPVSKTFQVRNEGGEMLEITGVSTSCGCTAAEIGDRTLAPGETTDLMVTYDPQAHGGQTGQFMRVVYVRSNDPETPEATLTIQVTVTEP